MGQGVGVYAGCEEGRGDWEGGYGDGGWVVWAWGGVGGEEGGGRGGDGG